MTMLQMICTGSAALWLLLCLLGIRSRFWRRTSSLLLRGLLLGGATVVTLMPLVWLLCASFKDASIANSHVLLPPPWEWGEKTADGGRTLVNLHNFEVLFAGREGLSGVVRFWVFVANSLFLATVTTVLSMMFCSLAGFALAKYEFRGSRTLMMLMLGTMMMPGMLFLAPGYRLMHALGWLDTYYALVVPGLCSAFGIFLFRQAISAVPGELIEAARMDGAGEVRIWWQVVMPLVKPMTGAYCLITFLGAWNNYLGPQIYISSEEKLTLPVVLNEFVGFYSNEYGVFLAGTLIAVIPPAILFFSLQREFIAGLTAGAVKG